MGLELGWSDQIQKQGKLSRQGQHNNLKGKVLKLGSFHSFSFLNQIEELLYCRDFFCLYRLIISDLCNIDPAFRNTHCLRHPIRVGFSVPYTFETLCDCNIWMHYNNEVVASSFSRVILACCLWHFVTSSSYQQCLFEQVYAPPARLHLCLGYCSHDRVVKQTEQEF